MDCFLYYLEHLSMKNESLRIEGKAGRRGQGATVTQDVHTDNAAYVISGVGLSS